MLRERNGLPPKELTQSKLNKDGVLKLKQVFFTFWPVLAQEGKWSGSLQSPQ